MKTKLEEFTDILKHAKKDDIIPFLKTLTDKDRKAIAKELVKFNKAYDDFHNADKYGMFLKRSLHHSQKYILNLTNICCFSFSQFRRHAWSSDEKHFDKILPFYVPPWFDEFLAFEANNQWGHLSPCYTKLIEWQQYAAQTIPESLIAEHICYANFEDLIKNPQALQTHIWTFFKFEAVQDVDYGYQDRYITKTGVEAPYRWYGYFFDLISLGAISREKVLVESLSASHGHMNKPLLCWFAGLFEFLEPTNDEIVQLQDNLFAAFQSNHSKPANVALKYLAKIASEDTFKAEDFISHVPQLFSSTVKATHNATFKVLNQLVKNKTHQSSIAHAATHAFFISDAATQAKAVKLITKYGSTDDAELSDALGMYADTILSQSKHDLAGFLQDDYASGLPDTLEFHHEVTPIKPIDSFDDLVFLLPSVFENNHIYDYELALDGLIRFQDALIPENFERLTPAFTAAYKCLKKTFMLKDNLSFFAVFLVDVLRSLVEKYPVNQYPESTALADIDTRFIADYEKDIWSFNIKKETLETCLKSCETQQDGSSWINYSDVYWQFKVVIERFENNETHHFLSTPSLAPCFVCPLDLVERLQHYQANHISIHTYDFQQALCRVHLPSMQKHEAFLPSVASLNGEVKQVLQHLYSQYTKTDSAVVPAEVEHPEWWITVDAITNPDSPSEYLQNSRYKDIPQVFYTGQHEWSVRSDSRPLQERDYVSYYQLQISYPETTAFKLFAANYVYQTKNKFIPLNGSQLWFDAVLSSFYATGILHPLFYSHLVPNNIDLIFVGHLSEHSRMFGSNTKERVGLLGYLNQIIIKSSEMTHLFIADSLVHEDKPARQLAGELWVQHVDKINQTTLGYMLGIMQAHNAFPLKRLTDLMQESMLNISQEHNQALQQLILAVLAELSEKPVKGLKKSLEILLEVQEANQVDISSLIDEKLQLLLVTWGKVANLKKAVKALGMN